MNNRYTTLPKEKADKFLKELTELINKYSIENTCNTPDFILAEHMMSSLLGFIITSQDREKWFDKYLTIGSV